jgi:DnaK suppressor protein
MSAKVTTIGRLKRRKRVLAVLEAKLKELLRSSAERQELEIENLADPLDQVRCVVDRDIAVRSLNQKSQLIQEVRSAIGKVRSETFGICEECEAAIAPQRLDAIPWARLCVKCQNRAEARNREAIGFGHAA